jgi:ABC-2 type transport system permease protein
MPMSCFDGDHGSSTAWWGAALTVVLGLLGWRFGVRRFRQESG